MLLAKTYFFDEEGPKKKKKVEKMRKEREGEREEKEEVPRSACSLGCFGATERPISSVSCVVCVSTRFLSVNQEGSTRQQLIW